MEVHTCVHLAHKRELWDSSNDKKLLFIEQLRYNTHCSLHTFSCLIFRVTLLFLFIYLFTSLQQGNTALPQTKLNQSKYHSINRIKFLKINIFLKLKYRNH